MPWFSYNYTFSPLQSYMYILYRKELDVTYNLIRMCTTILFKNHIQQNPAFFRTSKGNKTWFEKSASSRNWG